jgi:predicted DNA-binding transcriptional regulator YafY
VPDKQKQFQRLLRLTGELLGGIDATSRRQIQRDLAKLWEYGLPLHDSESYERPPRYWLNNLRVAGAH